MTRHSSLFLAAWSLVLLLIWIGWSFANRSSSAYSELVFHWSCRRGTSLIAFLSETSVGVFLRFLEVVVPLAYSVEPLHWWHDQGGKFWACGGKTTSQLLQCSDGFLHLGSTLPHRTMQQDWLNESYKNQVEFDVEWEFAVGENCSHLVERIFGHTNSSSNFLLASSVCCDRGTEIVSNIIFITGWIFASKDFASYFCTFCTCFVFF